MEDTMQIYSQRVSINSSKICREMAVMTSLDNLDSLACSAAEEERGNSLEREDVHPQTNEKGSHDSVSENNNNSSDPAPQQACYEKENVPPHPANGQRVRTSSTAATRSSTPQPDIAVLIDCEEEEDRPADSKNRGCRRHDSPVRGSYSPPPRRYSSPPSSPPPIQPSRSARERGGSYLASGRPPWATAELSSSSRHLAVRRQSSISTSMAASGAHAQRIGIKRGSSVMLPDRALSPHNAAFWSSAIYAAGQHSQLFGRRMQRKESCDDSVVNYSCSGSVGQDESDLVEQAVKDDVRIQKMLRNLRRHLNSPDNIQSSHPTLIMDSVPGDLGVRRDRRLTLQTIGPSHGQASVAQYTLAPQFLTASGSSYGRSPKMGAIGRSASLNPSSQYLEAEEQEADEAGGSYASRTAHDRKAKGERFREVRHHSFDCRVRSPMLAENMDLGDGLLASEFPEVTAKLLAETCSVRNEKEEQSRQRATVIVTSGALTFVVLAASLVTLSFLMAPLIERVFVRDKLNQTIAKYNISQTELNGSTDVYTNSFQTEATRTDIHRINVTILDTGTYTNSP